eukprot:COSAG02_NODE_65031_length_259_cov_0.637500_1_plen_58_part_10
MITLRNSTAAASSSQRGLEDRYTASDPGVRSGDGGSLRTEAGRAAFGAAESQQQTANP